MSFGRTDTCTPHFVQGGRVVVPCKGRLGASLTTALAMSRQASYRFAAA